MFAAEYTRPAQLPSHSHGQKGHPSSALAARSRVRHLRLLIQILHLSYARSGRACYSRLCGITHHLVSSRAGVYHFVVHYAAGRKWSVSHLCSNSQRRLCSFGRSNCGRSSLRRIVLSEPVRIVEDTVKLGRIELMIITIANMTRSSHSSRSRDECSRVCLGYRANSFPE